MDSALNSIQGPKDEVAGRNSTSPDGLGPLAEELNAATRHPIAVPSVPEGSEVTTGWRRRDYLWPEVHDPFDTELQDIDPRATGDPIGDKRPVNTRFWQRTP